MKNITFAVLVLAALLVIAATFLFPPPRHSHYAFAAGGNVNFCESTRSTVTTVVTTSGTAAVQLVGLSAGNPIYVCSLVVVGVSGTTPTFSLVYGTGANCGTGQQVLVGAFATPASTPVIFPGDFTGATPAGNALCYLDGGTTPVQIVTLVTAQG